MLEPSVSLPSAWLLVALAVLAVALAGYRHVDIA